MGLKPLLAAGLPQPSLHERYGCKVRSNTPGARLASRQPSAIARNLRPLPLGAARKKSILQLLGVPWLSQSLAGRPRRPQAVRAILRPSS